MRKMTLRLDALEVESFATLPPGHAGGTVLGRQEAIGPVPALTHDPCDSFGMESCKLTCAGSCGRTCETCDPSCNPQTHCTCLATCMTCTLDICCACSKASGCEAHG